MKSNRIISVRNSTTFALLCFGGLFLASCASGTGTVLFDPPSGTPVPENTVVYRFPAGTEKKVFATMHPDGSSLPEVRKYGPIRIATWFRYSDEGTLERIAAVWTVGKPAKVALKTSGSISGFYDAEGKQLCQELVAGNHIRVSVSSRLLYLVGSRDLEVEIPEK